MPANLTQQYYAAEEAYKKASTHEEKLAALEEMLATIPKHKGTEKLQGELKKRLSKMKKEGGKTKGGGSRQEDPFLIDRQGAGQVLLLGWPNAGKSALVQTLTNAKTQVAEYPYSTGIPIPGMMQYEDIGIQLVDTPPFVPEGIVGNFSTAIRNCDMLLLVIDLTDPECADQLVSMLDYLKDKRILRDEVPQGVRALAIDRIVVLANKADIDGALEILELVKELVPGLPTVLPVSAETGLNLDELSRLVFKRLDVIRVYTKKPGKKPDLDRPFILPFASTVFDLAESIHKDIAENLKTAKVWGSSKFDGQAVNHDYVLSDKDIVELND